MISPTAIYATLLLAAPLFAVVIYSLMVDSKAGISAGLTFQNYIEVWTGRIDRALMIRSLTVSALVTLVTVLLAYPVAYFVSFHVKPEKKSLWLFLITIPFWTSYLIRVFLWKVILGYNGVINSGLLSLGIIDTPLTVINYSLGSMVMTLAHAYAAFAILPIFVSLEKIDRSFLEAGQDLGESKLMTFLRVTLPLSIPGVIAAVLIVAIPTIGDYVTPELIGGGKLPMIANRIEALMLKQNDKALGSAVAILSMIILGATIFVLYAMGLLAAWLYKLYSASCRSEIAMAGAVAVALDLPVLCALAGWIVSYVMSLVGFALSASFAAFVLLMISSALIFSKLRHKGDK